MTSSAHGVESAANIKKPGNRIVTWTLFNNQIGHAEIRALCDHGLSHRNNRLQELVLAGNLIGDLGAEHLAHSLHAHEHNQLRYLKLYNNGIREQGTLALIQALTADRNQVRWFDLPAGSQYTNHALVSALRHPNCRIERVSHELLPHVRQALLRGNIRGTLYALLSARQIRRLGRRAAVARLPYEMIRLVSMFIQVPWQGEEEVDGDNDDGDEEEWFFDGEGEDEEWNDAAGWDDDEQAYHDGWEPDFW
ncbi:hypothetical protein BASA81_005752 [Batrachochytrium salamandrivorans]|nr:hypothetical protein BASA81_005752 [Batrachochytrium salamandrivorans]